MHTRHPNLGILGRRLRSIAVAAAAALLLNASPASAADDSAGGNAPPNFLIILADDAGYSDTGSYGGEINTPTLDRLADEGLRFTNFYSTARCWPSRTAILTGYYAPQVRMDPVRRRLGSMPPWGRMLPQYLERAGYRSYHSGKWHIHLENNPVADGRFDRSYRVRDHDRYFTPRVHYLDDESLDPVSEEEDYYQTTAMAERAIEFLRQHHEDHADKPWFTYLAFTAPHFPLHAPQEDIDRYRDRYLEGWDEIRRQRLQRMKDKGIVSENVSLPPLEPGVVPPWNMITEDMQDQFGPIEERKGPPWVNLSIEKIFGPHEVGRALPWDELTEQQQAFQAEKMAIHAAMVDRMDREIARVIEQIEAMGDRDNTVILFMSDNGASGELIVRGDMHDPAATPGSGPTYLSLGPGWSTASNTPLRLHKHWTHEGGSASPLIVNWPAGLEKSVHGTLRHTPGHLVDLLPTMLELAGIEHEPFHPDAPPLPGKSLVAAFDGDGEIDRDVPIYLDHNDHRGLRAGDWKIVSRGDDERGWELYNLAEDRNELNNLADQYPDRLQQLAECWQDLHDTYEEQALTEYE